MKWTVHPETPGPQTVTLPSGGPILLASHGENGSGARGPLAEDATWGAASPRRRTQDLPHGDPARQCWLSPCPPRGLDDPSGGLG